MSPPWRCREKVLSVDEVGDVRRGHMYGIEHEYEDESAESEPDAR